MLDRILEKEIINKQIMYLFASLQSLQEGQFLSFINT